MHVLFSINRSNKGVSIILRLIPYKLDHCNAHRMEQFLFSDALASNQRNSN